MRRSIPLVIALVFLASCSGDAVEEGPEFVLGSPHTPGAPAFKVGTVLIDGADEGSVLLDAEIADTEETRSYGLMNRTSIPDDYGMVFFVFKETECCFWMEDTLVPLSIAFFDADGTIVDIEDMDPCKVKSCPLYSSDAPYIGALEVKQGLFEKWGVSVGDRIRVVQ